MSIFEAREGGPEWLAVRDEVLQRAREMVRKKPAWMSLVWRGADRVPGIWSNPPLLPGDVIRMGGQEEVVRMVNLGMMGTMCDRRGWVERIDLGLDFRWGKNEMYYLDERPIAVVSPPERPRETSYLLFGRDLLGEDCFQRVRVNGFVRRALRDGKSVLSDGRTWGPEGVRYLSELVIERKCCLPVQAVLAVGVMHEVWQTRRWMQEIYAKALPLVWGGLAVSGLGRAMAGDVLVSLGSLSLAATIALYASEQQSREVGKYIARSGEVGRLAGLKLGVK